MISETGNYGQFNPFDGQVFSIPSNGYYPEILEAPGNIYYHGYWINKDWFGKYAEIFRQEFCFPEITEERNFRYQEQITTSHSVSIHVRRGDYVTLKWELDMETYRSGTEFFMKQVPGEWHLFVFSDDIAWCREHEQQLGFLGFSEVTYVEGNVCGENYRDLQLMSMCEAMILSNSAFSYLAALLNPGRIYTLNLSDRML